MTSRGSRERRRQAEAGTIRRPNQSRRLLMKIKSEAPAVNHRAVSYISDNEFTLPHLTLVLQFIIFEINKGENLSELSAGNFSRAALSIKARVSCLSLGLEELNKPFPFNGRLPFNAALPLPRWLTLHYPN